MDIQYDHISPIDCPISGIRYEKSKPIYLTFGTLIKPHSNATKNQPSKFPKLRKSLNRGKYEGFNSNPN